MKAPRLKALAYRARARASLIATTSSDTRGGRTRIASSPLAAPLSPTATTTIRLRDETCLDIRPVRVSSRRRPAAGQSGQFGGPRPASRYTSGCHNQQCVDDRSYRTYCGPARLGRDHCNRIDSTAACDNPVRLPLAERYRTHLLLRSRYSGVLAEDLHGTHKMLFPLIS